MLPSVKECRKEADAEEEAKTFTDSVWEGGMGDVWEGATQSKPLQTTRGILLETATCKGWATEPD